MEACNAWAKSHGVDAHKHGVEFRASPLGGLGAFATKAINAGDTLLLLPRPRRFLLLLLVAAPAPPSLSSESEEHASEDSSRRRFSFISSMRFDLSRNSSR